MWLSSIASFQSIHANFQVIYVDLMKWFGDEYCSCTVRHFPMKYRVYFVRKWNDDQSHQVLFFSVCSNTTSLNSDLFFVRIWAEPAGLSPSKTIFYFYVRCDFKNEVSCKLRIFPLFRASHNFRTMIGLHGEVENRYVSIRLEKFRRLIDRKRWPNSKTSVYHCPVIWIDVAISLATTWQGLISLMTRTKFSSNRPDLRRTNLKKVRTYVRTDNPTLWNTSWRDNLGNIDDKVRPATKLKNFTHQQFLDVNNKKFTE